MFCVTSHLGCNCPSTGEVDYVMESRGPRLATSPVHSWRQFVLGADGPLVLQRCLKSFVVITVVQMSSVGQDKVLHSLVGLSLLAGTLRK